MSLVLPKLYPLLVVLVAITISAILFLVQGTSAQAAPAACRNVPGDAGWPTTRSWNQLNKTVGGRLIKTIPIGSSCYKNTVNVANRKDDIHVYNEATCENVQKNWHEPTFHDESSSSVMQTYFGNNSCNPINVQGDCGIGSHVQYAIDVRNDQDAIAGIAFARKYNIRLVIRNTGHEYLFPFPFRYDRLIQSSYLGKSTGFGALALWTHHLKDISPVIQYKSNYYSGPALKVSAGVQVSEVYNYLEKQQYTAVGGECPSVGIAGGYIFAGGHSPGTSLYGLAADGILEMSGIFANGSHFTASPTHNQDLYWFLSGSGAGGTVAYMSSVTFRIFKDFPVSGVSFIMPYAGILTEDEFWPVIDTWHSITPDITAAGAYAYAFYQQGYLQIWPLFLPLKSESEALNLLKPLISHVERLKKTHPKLNYNLTASSYPSFNTAYKALFPHLLSGTFQWSSRLIPKTIIQNHKSDLSKTFRSIFNQGAAMVEAIMNPSLQVSRPVAPNSVLPAWRTSIIDVVAGTPYNDSAPFEQMRADRKFITENWTPALEKLAPVERGGGAYMNEADADDPNWRESFYGFYERQLAIKRKYDPEGLWYAKTAVGSEFWAEDEAQRLCRVK
ncbi:MAG: hypothetical protein Q9223_004871 [Gallowayella weberi]